MAKWNLDKLDNRADDGYATIKWRGKTYLIDIESVNIKSLDTRNIEIVGTVKKNFSRSTT